MIKKYSPKTMMYLILFLLMISIGFHLYDHSSYGKIAVSAEEVDRYKVHTELLLQAVEELGVCTPDAAVEVFIKSIKNRNGAMLYTVLSDSLKKNYLSKLEENTPYWLLEFLALGYHKLILSKRQRKKKGAMNMNY